MIIDVIGNFAFYAEMDKRLRVALPFFERVMKFPDMEEGRYDIDSDRAYGLIRHYYTSKTENIQLEAHRKYIDIHLIIKGHEKMQYQAIKRLVRVISYTADSDCEMLTGNSESIRLSTGKFVILYPQDAHLLKLCDKNPSQVTKAIVKVKI